MKIFVYKTIFILVGIYLLYQFTIGIKIESYERNLKNFTNDQGREKIRNKIRDELRNATREINSLKSEMHEIKNLLIGLVGKQ